MRFLRGGAHYYGASLPLHAHSMTNGFSLMGDEVLGITKNKYDLVNAYQFEHYEVINSQYEYLIPFSPDGFGNSYCFDTRIKTNQGFSNQIVF